MKLAIVTACPNGMVTSVLCARLLDAAAQRQGWSTSVEVNDAAHPERQLSAINSGRARVSCAGMIIIRSRSLPSCEAPPRWL